ncbi:MAG: efflux RND transporter periplasmic adaptor subunit [Caldilineaceae bacterium]|nr:efflux RND transporter periplasmic adaptor subunit [Caldilineaceae bacterium]
MSVRPLAQRIGGVLLATLLGGCALLPAANTDRSTDGLPTPTPIPTAIVPTKPTYQVQRGEIVNELEFSGRISPVLEEDLFFRASGRVRSVFRKRNDMVAKGEVLAELEIDALERELEAAELELERARVRLEQAQQENSYAIEVAQTNIEIAELKLQALRSEAAPDQTAISVQEKEIGLARLALEQLQAGVDPLLQSDVTRAELAVTKLHAEIAESQIIASFDGQLLSMSLTPGQAVDAYQPVATLADVENLEVSADLISTQMEDLVESMPAKIILVSRPGVTLDGSVRQLPYPYGSGGRGNTVEDMDKSTRISIAESAQDEGFALGDLVRVNVELERKDNVLWVPPQALRIFDGRRFALLQDGDVQRRVDVTVGIETPDRVEIESGLEEGQVVVGQ